MINSKKYILLSCFIALFFNIAAQNAASSILLPPPISIDSINDPSPGYIFLATWDRNVPANYANFIFILDKNGSIVDSLRIEGAAFDFQVQSNGLLSYAEGDFTSNVPAPGEDLRHMVLDSDLTVVDSFKMKNGYNTDFHEFKLLPNGHALMMAYHNIEYDMSTIVEGGQTNAILVINVLQEQDADKNVVFEWRNIDYIPITESDEDLTASRVNYSTLNAFDIDDDGNILASFRNHSEIMKISRETGEILWRMGGRHGEFTYEDEHTENAPYYHARQHNIQKLPSGNISMFDNGQYHTPPYSRAVEYHIDEENKVATLVEEWQYPDGNIFSVTAGNAEKLPNGGWFIGYGVPHAQFVRRNAVEVHPDGSLALELSLPEGVLAYRVMKLPWNETIDERSYTHYEVREGDSYSFNDTSIFTGIEIAYNSLNAPGYNEAKITRKPFGPVDPKFLENITTVYPVSIIYEGYAINSQFSEIQVDLSNYPEIKDPKNTEIFYRPYPGQGLFVNLNTSYDNDNKVLIADINGFGELVFGAAQNEFNSYPPKLYEPGDQQEIWMKDTISFRWTGRGMYDSFNVQISTDISFNDILHEFNTKKSDSTFVSLAKNLTYFWRVNAVLNDHLSNWTNTWTFQLIDTTSSVNEGKRSYDQDNILHQNYPNPFASKTRISFSLRDPGWTTLKIYDQTGREIRTLVEEYMKDGTYAVWLDAGRLVTGLYYYELRSGFVYREIEKLIIIKE